MEPMGSAQNFCEKFHKVRCSGFQTYRDLLVLTIPDMKSRTPKTPIEGALIIRKGFPLKGVYKGSIVGF